MLDALLEAGWLIAAVVLPLIFSPNLVMVFGVPKSSFLWATAMIMALVFLLKGAVAGAPRPAGGNAAAPALGLPALSQWRLPWTNTPAPGSAPLIAATLTFITITALATIASVAPAVSWWGDYGSFAGLFTGCSLLVIFAIVATHLRTPRQLNWLMVAIVWSSVPFLRFGAALHWGFTPLPWSTTVVPSLVLTPAGDALTTGVYLAIIIPLTLYLALVSQAIEFRVIYVLLALALIAVLALIGTVGAWIGLACGLFVLALLVRGALATDAARDIGTVVSVIIAVVAIAGAVLFARAQDTSWKPGGWLQTAATAAHTRGVNLDYHRQIWQGTWALGLQRPILGWGPETFASTFGRTAPLSLINDAALGGQNPAQSYNLPLEIFQSSGFLGLLVWLATLAVFFVVCIRLLRRTGAPAGRVLAAALIAGMVAYMVTTLDTRPGLPGLLLFWLMLALAAALTGPLWGRLATAMVASPAVAATGDEELDVEADDPAIVDELPDAAVAPAPAPTLQESQEAESVDAGATTAAADQLAPGWRSLSALLAVAALVLFMVPAQPLGLFWDAVQQVRADAWSYDGSVATTNANYTQAARDDLLAYAAAPFQPVYGLNASEALLQDLENRPTQPSHAALVAQLNQSASVLLAAHELNPWNTTITAQLARMLGAWGTLAGKNRFAEAQALIQQAEKQHPNDLQFVLDWATTAQQLGNTDATIKAYQQAALVAPNDASLRLQIVSDLSSMVDTQLQSQTPDAKVAVAAATAGLAEARVAANLSSKNPGPAWLQVGALSLRLAEAEDLALGPKNAATLKVARQALADNEKALTYEPKDLTTAEDAISIAIFLGNPKEAYHLATQALHYHPGNSTLTQFIKSLPASVKK